MDKKGDLKFWVISALVVLVIAVVILIAFKGLFGEESRMISSLIHSVWGKLNETFGLMTPGEQKAAYEKINIEQKQALEELEKEATEIKKILTDAAENLKNKNYDNAISNYVQYYKECEKEFIPPEGYEAVGGGKWMAPTCRTVTDEGVKFRILNVLREKYFVSKQISKYEEVASIHKIIKKEEFDSAISLIKASIFLVNNDLENAKKDLDNYNRLYGLTEEEDEFNSRYYVALYGYYNANMYTEEYVPTHCGDVLGSFNEVIIFTNNYLEAFEAYKDKTLLMALNYKFIMLPSEKINSVCVVS